jgi:type IV secretory pathway VirB2 component (pilin)
LAIAPKQKKSRRERNEVGAAIEWSVKHMESLQALWQRYRGPILVGLAIGILIVLGFFGIATWHDYGRGDFLALLQIIVEIMMAPVRRVSI